MDVSDITGVVSLTFILPFVIIEFLSTSVIVLASKGPVASVSGSLCWWSGVSGSGEEEIVSEQMRATLLSVCVDSVGCMVMSGGVWWFPREEEEEEAGRDPTEEAAARDLRRLSTASGMGLSSTVIRRLGLRLGNWGCITPSGPPTAAMVPPPPGHVQRSGGGEGRLSLGSGKVGGLGLWSGGLEGLGLELGGIEGLSLESGGLGGLGLGSGKVDGLSLESGSVEGLSLESGGLEGLGLGLGWEGGEGEVVG